MSQLLPQTIRHHMRIDVEWMHSYLLRMHMTLYDGLKCQLQHTESTFKIRRMCINI